MELLNEVAPQRPHTALIAGIQQENRYIREIQQENRELRAALEDHQHALEHIMTKYRQHTTYQMRKTKIDFSLVQNEEQEQVCCVIIILLLWKILIIEIFNSCFSFTFENFCTFALILY